MTVNSDCKPSALENSYRRAVRNAYTRIEDTKKLIAFHEAQIATLRDDIDLIQSELNQLEQFKELVLGIEYLELSVRVYNALKRQDINTIGELLTYIAPGSDSLRAIRNFGSGSIDATIDALKSKGYLSQDWGK